MCSIRYVNDTSWNDDPNAFNEMVSRAKRIRAFSFKQYCSWPDYYQQYYTGTARYISYIVTISSFISNEFKKTLRALFFN